MKVKARVSETGQEVDAHIDSDWASVHPTDPRARPLLYCPERSCYNRVSAVELQNASGQVTRFFRFVRNGPTCVHAEVDEPVVVVREPPARTGETDEHQWLKDYVQRMAIRLGYDDAATEVTLSDTCSRRCVRAERAVWTGGGAASRDRRGGTHKTLRRCGVVAASHLQRDEQAIPVHLALCAGARGTPTGRPVGDRRTLERRARRRPGPRHRHSADSSPSADTSEKGDASKPRSMFRSQHSSVTSGRADAAGMGRKPHTGLAGGCRGRGFRAIAKDRGPGATCSRRESAEPRRTPGR